VVHGADEAREILGKRRARGLCASEPARWRCHETLLARTLR
jgi:hypothetical protein